MYLDGDLKVRNVATGEVVADLGGGNGGDVTQQQESTKVEQSGPRVVAGACLAAALAWLALAVVAVAVGAFGGLVVAAYRWTLEVLGG
jgi:hypothetical protein